MRCLLGLLVVLVSISTITASYNGPFILWGRDELAQVKTNSLSELDAKFLHNIYSDSPAIILFVRNASTHLKKDQFPIFADLLSKTNYVYLTQQHLGVDPIEFNLNAEVITISKSTIDMQLIQQIPLGRLLTWSDRLHNKMSSYRLCIAMRLLLMAKAKCWAS